MSRELEITKRHVEAVTHMLLGQKMIRPGVAIVAGERLDTGKRLGLGRMARQSDHDIIYLSFEHTDCGYRMVDITIAAPRDVAVYSYPSCRLSTIGKRTIIMPPNHVRGHFVLEPGKLIHKPAKPDRWRDGISLAQQRLAELVARVSTSPGK